MVMVPSQMLPLGTPAPDFSLVNAVDGRTLGLQDFAGKPALLVMFICNHCPFVVHVRDEFGRIEKDYASRGLAIVAINSNDLKMHADDGPAHMKELVARMGWGFPFLFDATQEVAKAYTAACTPDLYLFDGSRKLAYRGQLDDSRPGNDQPVNGRDLRAAIESVLAGKPVPTDQKPSAGCNIKWAPGNEPEYFRVSRAVSGARPPSSLIGTVGCVALDKSGNLAAGTSTGGLKGKMVGRVGDSPILGAGTYADNATCAVSGTGIGEQFIRHAVAYDISAQMAYRGVSLQEAVRIQLFERLRPGDGGIIGVGKDGQITMQFSTAGMPRAAADSTGRFEVKLGRD